MTIGYNPFDEPENEERYYNEHIKKRGKIVKFLYRPHHGTLAEAMQNVKEFDTFEQMLDYIQEEHKIGKAFPFNKEEIRIAYYGYDRRIDWETYIVTVDRYFNDNYLKKYQCPQAIGFMTFKYDR